MSGQQLSLTDEFFGHIYHVSSFCGVCILAGEIRFAHKATEFVLPPLRSSDTNNGSACKLFMILCGLESSAGTDRFVL